MHIINTPFSLSTRESRFNIAFGSTKCSSTSPRTMQSALQLSCISDFVLNLAISPSITSSHMFLAIAAASLSNSTPIYFKWDLFFVYMQGLCAASNSTIFCCYWYSSSSGLSTYFSISAIAWFALIDLTYVVLLRRPRLVVLEYSLFITLDNMHTLSVLCAKKVATILMFWVLMIISCCRPVQSIIVTQ